MPMINGATYVYSGYVSEPSELPPPPRTGDAVAVFQVGGASSTNNIYAGQWTPFSINLSTTPGQATIVGFQDVCSFYCAFEVMSPTVTIQLQHAWEYSGAIPWHPHRGARLSDHLSASVDLAECLSTRWTFGAEPLMR